MTEEVRRGVRGVNACSFSGKVTEDPTLRTLDNGSVVATLKIAVHNVDSDNVVKNTAWITIQAWNAVGRALHAGARKDDRVVVLDARMQTRSWVNKEGVTQYFTEFVIEDIGQFGVVPARVESPQIHEEPADAFVPTEVATQPAARPTAPRAPVPAARPAAPPPAPRPTAARPTAPAARPVERPAARPTTPKYVEDTFDDEIPF
jgi:single stranded DNA-binding protein